jgi:hypothetical protein
MIGGIDIVIPHANREQAAVASLRVIRRFWRDAVVEDAYTGKKTHLTRDALLPEVTDVFVYPDMETADKWDRLGAEPELANTMIHILVRDSAVTLVVDDPDSGTIAAIISGLRAMLSMYIFSPHARAKGAAA